MPLPAAVTATIVPSSRAAGQITVPGDKSISHRYALLAALAHGVSTIQGYSHGFDCRTTLACLRSLGVGVEWAPGLVTITGRGSHGLSAPAGPLDCENSGTTMRLLAGIAAGQPFETTLTGDESLRRRPMRRVIAPLTAMGARLESDNGRPPLRIHGGFLHGIAHSPEIPSAQIKSCVLLAGLLAEGTTSVEERTPTRDHTERAIETFNGRVARDHGVVSVVGGQRLEARALTVPGDISGATFWCVLAAGTPGGRITIDGVGLNPSRTAVLDVLRRAGARVTVEVVATSAPEPAGSIHIEYGDSHSFVIEPGEVAGVIDEIPALAALAAMMPEGRTLSVRGAGELRVKESDRIASLAAGFRAMGSDVVEYEDGFTLTARRLHGTVVDSVQDHRLAMAFAVAATRADRPVTILGAEAAAVSYPDFMATLATVTGEG